MARRILACEPRSLHAATITLAASSPAGFEQLRRSIHNVIAYRRRQSRWWRSVGLWAWWNGSGLHGLVELGSITATEFAGALERYGDVRLRSITIEMVRAEVYRAAQSVSACPGPGGTGRYQPFKIAIEPVIVAARAKPLLGNVLIVPMPILL
ncbi:hypothetical protein [Bosea sp. ANAM02]|uniref:hypothetical protein n=1 Tax=Bosea sp. ANAM02 TaxID=2020412 RepID=UPI00140EB31C|nr:hypothetical protein [Bosea sp. ANAM02]BCB19224.1 hypothetical protein OCUBac02_21180 [Bosea sp. ANAM02]